MKSNDIIIDFRFRNERRSVVDPGRRPRRCTKRNALKDLILSKAGKRRGLLNVFHYIYTENNFKYKWIIGRIFHRADSMPITRCDR